MLSRSILYREVLVVTTCVWSSEEINSLFILFQYNNFTTKQMHYLCLSGRIYNLYMLSKFVGFIRIVMSVNNFECSSTGDRSLMFVLRHRLSRQNSSKWNTAGLW
jgi:hypothetical protein